MKYKIVFIDLRNIDLLINYILSNGIKYKSMNIFSKKIVLAKENGFEIGLGKSNKLMLYYFDNKNVYALTL